MFKFTGALLILISAVLIFYRKSIVDYCTYKYIGNIILLINKLETECMYGKTYTYVLKNFSKEYKENLILETHYWFSSQGRKDDVKHFLSQIGKRLKEEEILFLKQSREQFKTLSYEYRKEFETSNKINLISGFSVGAILLLVII